MDELDRFLKKMMKSRYKRGFDGSSGKTATLSNTPDSSECLSEELFASYLDSLSGKPGMHRSVHSSSLQEGTEEKEMVEKHILECQACFEMCALLIEADNELKSKGGAEAPQGVIEETKRLLHPDGSPFREMAEVVLKFTRDTVKMVRATAGIKELTMPVMEVARSGDTAEEPNFIQFSKEFGSMRLEIVVEKSDGQECDIEVKASDRKSGRPAENTRITINSRGRELASYLADNGQALFRGFQVDNYTIDVARGRDTAGSIHLTSI